MQLERTQYNLARKNPCYNRGIFFPTGRCQHQNVIALTMYHSAGRGQGRRFVFRSIGLVSRHPAHGLSQMRVRNRKYHELVSQTT